MCHSRGKLILPSKNNVQGIGIMMSVIESQPEPSVSLYDSRATTTRTPRSDGNCDSNCDGNCNISSYGNSSLVSTSLVLLLLLALVLPAAAALATAWTRNCRQSVGRES